MKNKLVQGQYTVSKYFVNVLLPDIIRYIHEKKINKNTQSQPLIFI